MRQRERLYRRLGVEDAPSARNYAALLSELSAKAEISSQDALVHGQCLAWLANALDREDPDVHQALKTLRNEPMLINLLGGQTFADEAAWLDSPVLAEPFGSELNQRLVSPPQVSRLAAARFFRELGVVRLSDIAREALSEVPNSRVNIIATGLLKERSDLLLWLGPSAEFRERLGDILSSVKIHNTETLQVHVEITEFDPPVRSPASPAAAFYATESSILYVRSSFGDQIDWPAAFRALFAPLEQLSFGVDMPPVIMTAAYVTSFGTWQDAERSLRNSNYQEPEGTHQPMPLTDALTDADEELAIYETFAEDAPPENAPPVEAEEKSEISSDAEIVMDALDREGAFGNLSAKTTAEAPAENANDDDEPFKSKSDDGIFGRTEIGVTAIKQQGTLFGSGGNSNGWIPNSSRRPSPTGTERQERKSRMLSYVNAAAREDAPAFDQMPSNDLSDRIDAAAIEAVLKYERQCGRNPVEQSHNNPGFDIISTSVEGPTRRLIEVKGLEGAWNERGVKLSHVQFAMAQQYPGEYWVYVVEFSRDIQKHQVSAIANPFSKVLEYWFDHGWRGVTEELASTADLNLRIGARVKHAIWQIGTIEKIEKRGSVTSVVVNFGFQGRKFLPYSTALEFVD
ncbi:hypothetical protein CPY51_29845 [Rhizobium tubonense]|uniref:Protein NO VEIN C-terminal domain-containing protein n=2 Tax=Rhizobium tubonense TaxID=484088 RepID=A0A2W4C2R1_9HYPH|nr:hypothetical protein CPY51_29845 [Rhizobium tubonense]